MDVVINRARLSLIQGDVTRQTTEAIVNAANSSLMGGGGVDGAIHGAGGPAILEECRQIVSEQGRLPTGKAVITTGGDLRARYVIHAVGPVWHGGHSGEPELLASAYRESLRSAVAKGIGSISFPSISTGAYGYPVELAAEIALQTVIEFLHQETALNEVVFVLFDARTRGIYGKALKEIMSKDAPTE